MTSPQAKIGEDPYDENSEIIVGVQVTQALKNTGFLPDVNGEGSSSSHSPELHNNLVPDGSQEVRLHIFSFSLHLWVQKIP